MWISRRVYEDQKKLHQQLIEVMATWVEYMQLQNNTPMVPVGRPQIGAATDPESPDMALHVSDEESDLREARAMDLISEEQLEEGLRQLNFLNNEVVASS